MSWFRPSDTGSMSNTRVQLEVIELSSVIIMDMSVCRWYTVDKLRISFVNKQCGNPDENVHQVASYSLHMEITSKNICSFFLCLFTCKK